MIGELQFKVADHVANDVPKGPTGAACVHCEDFVDTAKILLMPAGLVSTFHGPCCACRREKRGRNGVFWLINQPFCLNTRVLNKLTEV